MNDVFVTLVGNVTAPPRHVVTRSGVSLASLRVASTPRRFDRASGEWRDGVSLFVTVVCWRGLADNVAASVTTGDPVVVSGRLRARPYEGKDGVTRTSIEIEATTVGHDLTRGVTRFQRVRRLAGGVQPEIGHARPEISAVDDVDPGDGDVACDQSRAA